MSETNESDSADQVIESVVMLSGDLLFSSRVKSAAQRAGFEFRVGGNLPTDNTASIRFVILDLSTRSKLTESLVAQCDEHCPDAKLIAYGPHVQVGKLKAARAAGISTVMTNGQFDSMLPQIFDS